MHSKIHDDDIPFFHPIVSEEVSDVDMVWVACEIFFLIYPHPHGTLIILEKLLDLFKYTLWCINIMYHKQ